jgi:hemerythrin
MAFIEWSDDLSVKVQEIDEQHKKLIGMINALNDAMGAGKSKDALKGILDGMVDYTVMHFGVEEKYMEKFNFGETFQHKSEHKNFVKKTLELKNGFEENKLMISMEVMDFLKDWLQKHIKGIDKKYTNCFQENGLR